MARPSKRSRVQEDPKQEEQDDLAAMEASDSGSESEDNQEGMEYVSADGAIEFGADEPESKKLTGRRAKREKEAKKKLKAGTFDSMGLSPDVLKAIKRKGFRLPTPIQRRAMPIILQGADVIGMARTGSGKTAAFVIPMIEKLKAHSIKAGARALLLAPTRELALQTHKAVRELARCTDLRTAVLVGGDAMEAQFAELANNPDILVATPGRLLHHLAEVQGMSLRTVEYCVLDEADRLFEMGFAEQIKEILGKLSDTRQTLLFSATLPRSLADFAAAGLNAPQLVRLDTERKISPDLSQLFFTVRQDDKIPALLHLVREVLPADQLTIIFTATRHHVEYLSTLMARENIPAACVYGSMDQTARKIHVAKFRAKKVCLLITTDVAARGIDIPLIDNVINLDFPAKPELFVHRVGRAARMGRTGTAYSLLTREEIPYLLDLHLYLGRRVQPAVLAPTTAQIAEATTDAQDPDKPALYGSYPLPLLSLQVEKLRAVEAASTELSSMQKSLSNAFALYLKTRPPASAESVNRAKQLQKEGTHPVLMSLLPEQHRVDLEGEAALAEFTAALRSFRPAATVLEAEIAAVKATHTSLLLDSAAEKSRSNAVMQKKRQAHGSAIEKERQKRARMTAGITNPNSQQENDLEEGKAATAAVKDTGQDSQGGPGSHQQSAARMAAVTAMALGDGVLNEGKYRDTSLFISHTRDPSRPADETFQFDRTTAELEEAVMDMTAEDQEGMQAQARRWHWDKRKKRYVQLQGTEATAGQAAKRVRTESGAKVAGKDKERGKGLYQKWVKSQRKRVAAAGSMEDAGGSGFGGNTDALANRFHPSMKHTSWKGHNKADKEAMKGERLKSKDQVRKERVKKAQRKDWLQQKQQGGKKQQKGGDDWKPKNHGGGVQKRKAGGKQKGKGGRR